MHDNVQLESRCQSSEVKNTPKVGTPKNKDDGMVLRTVYLAHI